MGRGRAKFPSGALTEAALRDHDGSRSRSRSPRRAGAVPEVRGRSRSVVPSEAPRGTKRANSKAKSGPQPSPVKKKRKTPVACRRCGVEPLNKDGEAVAWFENVESNSKTKEPINDACKRCGDTWTKCLQQEGSWEDVCTKCSNSPEENARFDDIAAKLHGEVEKDFFAAEAGLTHHQTFYMKLRFRGLTPE